MKLWKKFIMWWNLPPKDRLSEKFDEDHKDKTQLVYIRFEFSNGLVRELIGESAYQWHKKIWLTTCGKRQNFEELDWINSFKPNSNVGKEMETRK